MRYILLVWLLSLCTAAQAVSSDPIPIELLFDQSAEFGHKLSPNAKRIAILTKKTDTTFLNIVRLPDLKLLKNFSLGKGYIDQLQWISDYRLVYSWNGSLWAVNTSGTERMQLANYVYDKEHRDSYSEMRKHLKVWRILDILPDAKEEILIGGHDRKGYETVSRINVFTGEKKDLANGAKYKINNWFVDKKARIRLALREKKGRFEMFRVEGDNPESLRLEPISTGDFSLSTSGANYAKTQAHFEGFANDDNIYISEKVGRDRFAISEFSLDQGKVIKTLAVDGLVDIGSHVSEGDSPLIIDPYTKELIGLRYQKQKLVQIWSSEELNNIQKKIDKALPEYVNVISDWNESKDTFIVVHYNHSEPGVSSVFFNDKNELKALNLSDRVTVDYNFYDAEWVLADSRDGNKIPSYFSSPEPSDKKIPLVVMPHGGPWARDVWGFDPYVQSFTSRGYAVLQPQFRGSDGFGRKHMLAAHKDLNGLMIDDIVDATRWATKNYNIDPDKVFIFGISYGGYAAIMSSHRYPKLYKAAVANCSPLDLIQQLKDYKKDDSYFAYDFWRTMVGDPKKDKALLKAASPSEIVKELNFPLYIMAGEDDDIVKVSQVEKFQKKVEKLKKKNIEIKIFKGEGHCIGRPSNATYAVEKILEFFGGNGNE